MLGTQHGVCPGPVITSKKNLMRATDPERAVGSSEGDSFSMSKNAPALVISEPRSGRGGDPLPHELGARLQFRKT